MGTGNRILESNSYEITVTCKHCNNKYTQWTEEQVPGCRTMDYDICPHCENVNEQSMTYEYHNKKIN